MATPAQFRLQVNQWADRVKGQIDAFARQFCFQVAYEIVQDTPVDTGFLRASWQPSLDEARLRANAAPDPSGGNVLAEIGIVIAGMQPGQIFYLTNNAEYARRLEYGFVGADALGREYNQAGRFFVTATMARADQIAARVAADLGG